MDLKLDEIAEKTAEAIGQIIPVKSAKRYEKEYALFCNWREQHNLKSSADENVMLAYFLDVVRTVFLKNILFNSLNFQSKTFNPSSLWSKYSMVKSMIMVNENVNISSFPKLIAFLKKQNVDHQPNQSKVLTKEQIESFMRDAPDKEYLLLKVIALLGVAGGCRREEIYNLEVSDVEDTGTQLVVKINQTKTHIRRAFTVINSDEVHYLDVFRKYMNLRQHVSLKALLVGYRQGKCLSQRAGIHTVGGAPKKIAEFLKLDQPEKYTGHCFRRTSSTLLANAGADLKVLKQHGGWKSSSVAEKYIEESIEGKNKIARMIQRGETFVEVLHHSHTSSAITENTVNPSTTPLIHIAGNSSCTINVNLQKLE